jgi:hypothetical protein
MLEPTLIAAPPLSDGERKQLWSMAARVHAKVEAERQAKAEREHALKAVAQIREYMLTTERVGTNNEFGRGYQRGKQQALRDIDDILKGTS